jgi:hypothetical protein
MKAKYIIVLLISILVSCRNDEEEIKDRGKEPHQEVPDLIAPSKPCSTLYKSIMDMFYEHENNQTRHPELFATTAQKGIVLTHDSKVFITFISEGAGFANSLGYYTYDAAAGPGSASDLNIKILFPHVSDEVLAKGDMLQLGTEEFKAGTAIGFFLIIRGWENGFVNYRKNIHFTDYQFNINQSQQHILFKEGQCGDIVMAFEDKTVAEGSDLDYNDVIFTISDTNEQLETVNFKLENMVTYESIEEPQ